MPDQRRIDIGGTPYLLTRNQWGWAVSPLSSPTDRLHRNYQVRCDSKGRPLSCSCPHCHSTSAWCKHLRAVEALLYEESAEERRILREAAARAGIDLPPEPDPFARVEDEDGTLGRMAAEESRNEIAYHAQNRID